MLPLLVLLLSSFYCYLLTSQQSAWGILSFKIRIYGLHLFFLVHIMVFQSFLIMPVGIHWNENWIVLRLPAKNFLLLFCLLPTIILYLLLKNPASVESLRPIHFINLFCFFGGVHSGAILYIKDDLDLGTSVEGLVVAMSLIGATAITTCSGAISDWIGRRPMLILSSMLYFISGLVMLWSPNVYILCIARLLDGFGIGLAVTLVPVYISETAPSEIRGLLNTLPQFTGSGGMFLSYCMVFGMSLMDSPSWRLMLGVLSIPSLLYFALTVFYLPESPRWLVSKGKMVEAKQVLQRLRGREDVSGSFSFTFTFPMDFFFLLFFPFLCICLET